MAHCASFEFFGRKRTESRKFRGRLIVFASFGRQRRAVQIFDNLVGCTKKLRQTTQVFERMACVRFNRTLNFNRGDINSHNLKMRV